MDKATLLCRATGLCSGVKQREAGLQTQCRHLQGSTSMSPFLLEQRWNRCRTLGMFGAEPFPSLQLTAHPGTPSPLPWHCPR